MLLHGTAKPALKDPTASAGAMQQQLGGRSTLRCSSSSSSSQRPLGQLRPSLLSSRPLGSSSSRLIVHANPFENFPNPFKKGDEDSAKRSIEVSNKEGPAIPLNRPSLLPAD